MSELERLRLGDIPEGRQLLREQHDNLHRVADYCQGNYLQASDKRKALEETMALSTQSLASVTYQVSSVASAFLRLLELQAAQLRQLEADIACVAQRVDIHKEKVARREIGALTVPKGVPMGPKVAAPPEPPELEPYYRKPLNFSALDGVGHGVKDTSTQLSRTGTLARKSTKSSSAQPAGTLGRSSRVPEPVQPPVVPPGKLPSAPSSSLGSLSSSSAPAAPGEGIPVPPPPPGPPPAVPPPPGPPPPAAAIPPPPALPAHLAAPPAPDDLELLPPPPAVPEFGDLTPPPPPAVPEFGDLTPPPPPAVPEFGDLTPPPPPDVPEFGDLTPPPPPAAEDPPWAPQNYLEKVVALYPYTGQKDNELSLEPGALLFVTRRFSDGWCEGVAEQSSGLFPGNYVESV
ncbi:ABI gene family member 3 [Catharus ustulatus]|uniref:ABI gene family member 3 n=1 Tax=Catharus ustulatus TaxID=91951 RepID=A0A8C3UV45_CATUS|nr:ABI gene family member 3 [Catharus ustulatus]